MDYLLDTNIIITYGRDNQYTQEIEREYELFSDSNQLYVSIVVLGELDAFIKKNKLGPTKIDRIETILSGVGTIGIDHGEIIGRYGDIDAYSQGKLASSGLLFSARNMGKMIYG